MADTACVAATAACTVASMSGVEVLPQAANSKVASVKRKKKRLILQPSSHNNVVSRLTITFLAAAQVLSVRHDF
jgi:hypothetical protein